MEWKLEVVVMPVADLDRAKHFYAEQVGFVVDHDTRINDNVRVIQMTPPGSGCSIVIGTGIADSTPGSVQGIQLVVADLDAARNHLAKRDVEISPIRHVGPDGSWVDGRGGRWNSFIFFSDPDGNGWAVQERPSGE